RIGEPRMTRWLFTSAGAAWIWLVVRIYFGYQWAHSGWDKVSDPAWMSSGEALRGFATYASTELTKGNHPPP
ncbi:MAG TPA: DoxX family protein, partial [Actinomycetota bacterium]|nr:DoxX family protein [Actinomycetota bacterium]